MPVRLRLAVSQATAESSTIEGLREFSETLGYFERPDTELIVRNLFDRAMLAGLRKQTDEPKLDDASTATQQKTAAPPSRDTKAMLRRAAMAAAVVIALGATSWLVVSAVNGGRAVAAFSKIANTLVVRRRVAPTSPSKAQSRRRRSQRKARLGAANAFVNGESLPGRSGGARKESAGPLAARIPSLVPAFASVMSPIPSRDASNASESAQTYVIEAIEPGESASDPIYSKSDSEVTPPQQVYPALPAELPAGLMKRALTVVDLVIAPDGLVEHVHLRNAPTATSTNSCF